MKKNYTFGLGTKLMLSLFLVLGTFAFASAQFTIVMGSSTATCEISSDGTAYVESQSGGIEPLVYSWGDGQDFVVAYDLMAGTHSVTVTDATGATATGSVEVELSPESVWLMPATADATCGECNGTIDPMAMLGLPPYTYAWSDGQTGAIATGLCAGSYTVTVTDSQGCANSTTAVVGENSDDCVEECDLTAGTVSTTDATSVCVDDGQEDSIDASVEGATGENSSWVITDENGNILAVPAASPFNFEGAPAGVCYIYNVTWNDDLSGLEEGANIADLVASCHSVSEGLAVTRTNLEITITEQAITSCAAADGALTVEGAGDDATYAWSNGGTDGTIDNLSDGEYTVTVTEGACEVVMTVALYDDASNIGDYVWYDNNENCRQDFYESGVAFVPVYLYSVGADGLACTEDDILEQSTGTNGDGYYLFECVEAGTYYVEFHATAVEPDYEYTCQDGADDAIDSDANTETGKTDPFDVTAGMPDITTIDAGINPICNDVNYGGTICCDQTVCAGEIPELIESTASAGGGGANPIEYLWMCASTPDNPGDPSTWTPIMGANGEDYQPGPVYQTKYFVRCARRGDCDAYIAESNTVAIRVVSCNQIIGFQIDAVSNNEVNLIWSVDGDSDANAYHVERSFDGINFETIASNTGRNAQNDVSTYLITDTAPKVGHSVYRIKQVVKTGNYHYSMSQELNIRLADEQKFNVFPNPARSVLTIENVEVLETQVQVDFMTSEGKVLHSTSFPEGTFKQEEISLEALPSGTYLVRVLYSDATVELLKVSKLID